MGEESIVEIKGINYRYAYDVDTQKTIYRGPVGDAPAISEQEFERHYWPEEVVAIKKTPEYEQWRKRVYQESREKGPKNPRGPSRSKPVNYLHAFMTDVGKKAQDVAPEGSRSWPGTTNWSDIEGIEGRTRTGQDNMTPRERIHKIADAVHLDVKKDRAQARKQAREAKKNN